MTTNYPSSLDALTNPTGSDTLASPSHAGQHANANDAIEAIEAELGTNPKGGSASVKARLDTADTTVAGKIPATLVDAKGDLIVATAADTVARKAVGTDGQSLLSDSTASGGVAWGNPPGVSPFNWTGVYAVGPLHRDCGTAVVGNGVQYFIPIRITHAVTVDRLGVEVVTTPGGTGSVVRLGIYRHDTATDLPKDLLVDAGTVDTTSTGMKAATVSQLLTPGTWWFSCAGQGSPTPGPTLRVATPIGCSSDAGLAQPTNCRYAVGQTGVFANPAPTILAPDTSSGVRILGRVA